MDQKESFALIRWLQRFLFLFVAASRYSNSIVTKAGARNASAQPPNMQRQLRRMQLLPCTFPGRPLAVISQATRLSLQLALSRRRKKSKKNVDTFLHFWVKSALFPSLSLGRRRGR
jgi:hypothetical protein